VHASQFLLLPFLEFHCGQELEGFLGNGSPFHVATILEMHKVRERFTTLARATAASQALEFGMRQLRVLVGYGDYCQFIARDTNATTHAFGHDVFGEELVKPLPGYARFHQCLSEARVIFNQVLDPDLHSVGRCCSHVKYQGTATVVNAGLYQIQSFVGS